jgi:hypothetical protein
MTNLAPARSRSGWGFSYGRHRLAKVLRSDVYMQCADCSHGIGSPDRLRADSGSDGRLQQLLQLLHPYEGRGNDMASILRD